MPRFDYDAYVNSGTLSHEQKTVVEDMKSYQVYLTNKLYFGQALSYLEAQLAAAQSKTGSIKQILSKELADKEVHCGLFKPGVNLYYQVLSDDAFNHLATLGMMFKDVGAGFVHGEYTHRIQWYVCMYHQTRGFGDQGYQPPDGGQPRKHHLTPAMLFISVTLFGVVIHKQYWPSRQVSGGGNLWDTLFDRNSNHVNDEDGITSPEAFNKSLFDTEKLVSTTGLGFSGIGTRAASYPTLSAIVTARYLKRTTKIVPESNEQLIAYATKKYEKEGSKYKTLTNPARQDETLEEQLRKGVLIPKN